MAYGITATRSHYTQEVVKGMAWQRPIAHGGSIVPPHVEGVMVRAAQRFLGPRLLLAFLSETTKDRV